MITLTEEMHKYWQKRAPSYSKQNLEELDSDIFFKWQNFIRSRLKNTDKYPLKVLDIGTGPGFLAIILSSLGMEVTGIDLTREMLDLAQVNSFNYQQKIKFLQMDATNLDFENESFDLVVTRNLTWNLENLYMAYKEWLRVLKKNGQILNFDANWYRYLFDENEKNKYLKSRQDVSELDIKDYYAYQETNQMEDLAKNLKTSKISRPKWDIECLQELGVEKIEVIENLNTELLTAEQKINFDFTSFFCIDAIK